jgi:hypothetical protein
MRNEEKKKYWVEFLKDTTNIWKAVNYPDQVVCQISSLTTADVPVDDKMATLLLQAFFEETPAEGQSTSTTPEQETQANASTDDVQSQAGGVRCTALQGIRPQWHPSDRMERTMARCRPMHVPAIRNLTTHSTHYQSVEARQNNTLRKPGKSDYTIPRHIAATDPDKDIRSGGGRKAILPGGTAPKGLNPIQLGNYSHKQWHQLSICISTMVSSVLNKMEMMATNTEIAATTIIAGSSRSHYQSLKQRQLLTRSDTGGTDKRSSIGSIYILFLNLTAPEKEGKIDPETNDLYHRSAGPRAFQRQQYQTIWNGSNPTASCYENHELGRQPLPSSTITTRCLASTALAHSGLPKEKAKACILQALPPLI